jgi:transcription elongation GreA/GreB family factor
MHSFGSRVFMSQTAWDEDSIAARDNVKVGRSVKFENLLLVELERYGIVGPHHQVIKTGT